MAPPGEFVFLQPQQILRHRPSAHPCQTPTRYLGIYWLLHTTNDPYTRRRRCCEHVEPARLTYALLSLTSLYKGMRYAASFLLQSNILLFYYF